MSRKPNKTGRSRGALTSFVGLERYLLNSDAWRSLKPTARAAYVEICYHYDGTNNGGIQLGARALGARLNVNKTTASRAIKELISAGFVMVAKHSAFSIKSKQVSEYRLTAFRCDVTGALPTKVFMTWVPKIQNTVAPAQLYGCTSATVTPKRTAKLPLQLRQRNHRAAIQPVHGCASAPLLYSTIGGGAKAGAAAAPQAASSQRPLTVETEGLTPLRDILDLKKLVPNQNWPSSQAA